MSWTVPAASPALLLHRVLTPALPVPRPLGAAFTRFQTLRLQKIFPQVLAEQLISYGSCQFPTLGFVVERFKAIQAFVPEVFHRIKGMPGVPPTARREERALWEHTWRFGAGGLGVVSWLYR